MGIKQIVTDDITGAELTGDVKPVKITFSGKTHELYLSESSADALAALVSGDVGPFAAMFAPAAPAKTRRARGTGPAKPATDTAAIRAWVRDTPAGKTAALAAGYSEDDVKALTGDAAKGRLKSDLIDAYNAQSKRPAGLAATVTAAA